MPTLTLSWTGLSKAQFDELLKRAVTTVQYELFVEVHNDMVNALSDLVKASENGELLYRTRLAGGEVRQWVHRFISIIYALFPQKQVGWIY